MRIRPLIWLGMAAAALGIWGQAVPPQDPPGGSEPVPETAVAVRLMFGVRERQPAVWDGEVRAQGARLLRTTGVHFEGEDAVLGPGRWRCSTRETRYADSRTPRGPDPVNTAPSRLIPNGVVVVLEGSPAARLEVATKSGSFGFRLEELAIGRPVAFLDGEATVERTPPVIALTRETGENDYPALAVTRSGEVWGSWIRYQNRADSVWAGRIGAPPERVTSDSYRDNFRTAIAEDGQRRLWVVWSSKGTGRWGLYGRYRRDGRWSPEERLTGDDGPNLYHTLVADSRGRLHLVWQGFRRGQSVILHRVWDGTRWSGESRVSATTADAWIPAAAADSKGSVWVGWDTYEAGNFDVWVRKLPGADPPLRVTRSPGFDANVSLAVDHADRLWISWDAGDPNWGKDWTSLRWKPGGGNGLYRTRSVRLAVLDAGRLRASAADLRAAIPTEYGDYFQMARLAVDATGRMWAMVRALTSFTTRVQNNWGAGGRWEMLLTALDGDRWTPAVRLDDSAGRNDVRAAAARLPDGGVLFAWAADRRLFRPPTPQKTDVFYTRLWPAGKPVAARLAEFQEPASADPVVHPDERAQVDAIRKYRYRMGGKTYRILRGDLHRHTDISNDGIGDGSLLDLYRYAFHAAQLDYILVADHNYNGTEYNWWRTEKSEEAFYVPGRFQPLFGTERSVPYPNGHRNVIFARRGVRELPISPEERKGALDTGPILYPYLRKFEGITTSHTPGTDQGTDWRDNDPDLEPLVELYQGLHTNYEYEGAPRAETAEKRYYFHGGPYRPAGFVWNAWAKGLKLGVQSSSDHIATHDSYACVLVEESEEGGREGILRAMKQRHAYAATDNIILDVRMDGHLMGDIFETAANPPLEVKVIGTGPIDRVEVVRNNRFVHTARPAAATAGFTFRDNEPPAGESYYYVRVEQADGQMAWSSPIWVRRK